MISHRRKKAARPRRDYMHRAIEALEDRRMLTALAGGDVFHFQQAPGQYIRVQLSGNIMAEFVGGVVDDQNQMIMTDLPGRFIVGTGNKSGMHYLGGVGGRYGITPVGGTGSTTIVGGPVPIGAGTDENNLQSLAASPNGGVWSINAATVQINDEDRRLVQVLELNTGGATPGAANTRAMIHGATLQEDRVAGITGVTMQGAMGDVAIANIVTGPGTFGAELWAMTQTGWLYLVNRDTGVTEEIAQIEHLDFPGGLSGVKAMAFDPVQPVDPLDPEGIRTDPNLRLLWVLTRDFDNDGGNDASGLPIGEPDPDTGIPPTSNLDSALMLVVIQRNPITGVWTAQTDMSLTFSILEPDNGYERVIDYTAMMFHPDGNLYATAEGPVDTSGGGGGGGGAAQAPPWVLHRIDLAGGFAVATNLGNIVAPGGGPSRIEGMTMAQDINGNDIIVAVDRTTVDNVIRPRLITFGPGNPGTGRALNMPGSIVNTFGIASFIEPGDTRPTLFTVTGGANGGVIRGSAISLATDTNGASTVAAIRASDFNPIDGNMYFVVDQAFGTVTGSQLYSMDANARHRTAIQNSLMRTPGNFGNRQVQSIVFDQTGPFTVRMLVAADNRIHIGSMTNTNFLPYAWGGPDDPITLDCDTPLGGGTITGLAMLGADPRANPGDDPETPDQFVYAVVADGVNSRLLRIRLSTGTAVYWGLVARIDNLVGDGPHIGHNIQGLTWHPNLLNPFTYQPGALLGTDTGTDQLVFIDHRLRPQTVNVFNINIAQSDADAWMYIAEYVPHPDDPTIPAPIDDWLIPFSGDTGQFRVINAQPDGDPFVTVSGNPGTGTVLVGVKTLNINCDDPNDDLRPILPGVGGAELRTPMTENFGMVPAADGWLRTGLFVRSGGVLNPIPQFEQAMIGQNVDLVTAASVRSDGLIALIDSDHINSLGNAVANMGEQLAIINATASDLKRVAYTLNVVDAVGNNLRGNMGIDWGDPDGDGIEQLFAIYPISGVPTLGIIDINTGIFSPIGMAGMMTRGASMAFSPGQQLYVADAFGGIHELNAFTGAYIRTAATVPFAIGSMDFNRAGALFVHDVRNGRLVDVNVSTGQVGNLIASPAGSVRPSIGAISYDPQGNRLVGFDNALSRAVLSPGLFGQFNEGLSESESSMFVTFAGFTNDIVRGQDIGAVRIGGTVTGQIDISGSIEHFYAGWLPLGATGGQELFAVGPAVPNNFRAGGEIRDVIVLDSIGTNDASALDDSVYTTGFDMVAGGRIQQVVSREDIMGSIRAINNGTSLPGMRAQQEVEGRSLGAFGGAVFSNDNRATPQYLGTINSTAGNNVIQVNGTTDTDDPDVANDGVDRYSVALMAGQTVVVHLAPQPGQSLLAHVGVFDPDGRLIATDYSDVDYYQHRSQRFTFTADRPGLYEFAVGFMGANDDFYDGGLPGGYPYQLRITASSDGVSAAGPGEIAIGAIHAARVVFDGRPTGNPWGVERGDLGAIIAGERVASMVETQGAFGNQVLARREDAIVSPTIRVASGNLRVIDGGSVGVYNTQNGYVLGVDVQVPYGSVGLVRATGADSTLVLNDNLLRVGAPAVSTREIGLHRSAAVGVDYQMVTSAGRFYGSMMADRAIGTVRSAIHDYRVDTGATSFAAMLPGFIVANADLIGDDGIIGLISVDGDLGNYASGGPAIITGPGGDLKYLYVGGDAYRDEYFGWNKQPEQTLTYPGETATFNDDSGAIVTISPISGTAQMTITTYPVRGSGGVAVVRVNAPGDVSISGRSGDGSAGVQIGALNVGGSMVQIGGTAPVDVFSITGGDFVSIANSSNGGEFVNITAGAITRLEATNIGVPRKIAGVDPAHITVRANAFPFAQQRISINAASIGFINARGALGNINVSGSIDAIVANAGRVNQPGGFNGIVAPIFAGGNIADVNIGQGLTSSGFGSFAHSGIFANGQIGVVRGDGADIRGNIVSAYIGAEGPAIGQIRLSNGGSIIGANIMVVGPDADSPNALATSREWARKSFQGFQTPVNQPDFYYIGSINISSSDTLQVVGNQVVNVPSSGGGIIGVSLMSPSLGDVIITRGFGIINSAFAIQGDGRIKNMSVDGYGYRDMSLELGAAMGRMVATGKGEWLDPANYTASVRQMQAGYTFTQQYGEFDRAPRFEPNATTDLHRYLYGWRLSPDGVWGQAAWDESEMILNAGVVAGTTVKASRSLDLLQAWQVRPSTRTGVYTFSDFDIGNQIKEFTVISDAFDMEVTTGSVWRMNIGRDLISPSITVAGIFSELKIGRDYVGDKGLRDFNIIQAIGGNGEISNIDIGRNVDGLIFAQRRIGNVRVRGAFLNGGRIVERTVQVAP